MLRNDLTFPKDSLLGRISDGSWDALSQIWSVSHYESGQFLITADDNSKDVFFVLRGGAKATIYTPGGREVSFVSLNVGDCFGEFAAIDNARRSASVVAFGECLAARLSPEKFRNLLQLKPDLTFILLTILVGHLRKLSQRVIDFNAKSADERLAEHLLELAQKHCKGRDDALIDKPPTQSDLAAFIFSSRESVAREMGRMRKAGVLARKKRSLFFPSIEKFRDYFNNQ